MPNSNLTGQMWSISLAYAVLEQGSTILQKLALFQNILRGLLCYNQLQRKDEP